MAKKMVKKVVKKPSSKKPNVKKKIIDTIIDVCNNSDELFCFYINNSYAFIIKKISVTTFYVNNASHFCPLEKYPRKAFFTAFYIKWGTIDVVGELIDFGIPVIFIKTEKEAIDILNSYDGETLKDD